MSALATLVAPWALIAGILSVALLLTGLVIEGRSLVWKTGAIAFFWCGAAFVVCLLFGAGR